MLFVGGRLVLVNSDLSSLLMFMLYFFRVPKEVLKKLYCFRSCFPGRVMNTRRNTD